MPHGGEGITVTPFRSLDDLVPVRRVGLMEQGKQAVQAGPGRVLYLRVQEYPTDRVAAGDVDRRLVENVVDQVVAGPLDLLLPCFHRLAGLDALRRRRRALGLNGRGRGVRAGDGLLEILGLLPGDVSVDDGGVVAGGTGITQDRLLLDLPAVPNPDRHGPGVGRGSISSKVEVELAYFLAHPMQQFGLLENVAAMGLQ